DQLGDATGITDVGDESLRASSRTRDLARDTLDAFAGSVDDGDFRTFVGKEVRGGSAHSTRGASHDGNSVGDRAAQCSQSRHGRPSTEAAACGQAFQVLPAQANFV